MSSMKQECDAARHVQTNYCRCGGMISYLNLPQSSVVDHEPLMWVNPSLSIIRDPLGVRQKAAS